MLTYYTADKLLNHLIKRDETSSTVYNKVFFSNTTSTSTPLLIYMGLSTTPPNQDGTGITEPVENGYERVFLSNTDESISRTFSDVLFDSGDNNRPYITNEKIIFFPEATGSWGTCTHFVLYVQEEGESDQPIAFGELNSSISPVAGKVPIIQANNMTLKFSSNLSNYFASLILQMFNGELNYFSLPTNKVMVGLLEGVPTFDETTATYTELSGDGYYRVLLGEWRTLSGSDQNTTLKMNESVDGESENSDFVFFPEPSATWNECSHFALFTDDTGGELLCFSSILNPVDDTPMTITPTVGEVPLIRKSDLLIAFQ
jgi:hypothetical protein